MRKVSILYWELNSDAAQGADNKSSFQVSDDAWIIAMVNHPLKSGST